MIELNEAARIHTHPCRLNDLCHKDVICVCQTPRIDPKVFCIGCQKHGLEVIHEFEKREIARKVQGRAQEKDAAHFGAD